eukprot:PITA_03566
MNSEKWKKAMEEEMDSLAKNNISDIVELPKGRSVVGCKWVFKLKWKVDGSIESYKARLVAKGHSSDEGNLMYAMASTQPNNSHAIGVVSMFMENPDEEHWRAVKWVLRYLRGTSDYCIIFNGSEGSICRYVDANYASDLDKNRSTTGYVFTLVGGEIRWMSKLQETISLSTTKVEYIAALDTCKEEILLKGLLDEIGRM